MRREEKGRRSIRRRRPRRPAPVLDMLASSLNLVSHQYYATIRILRGAFAHEKEGTVGSAGQEEARDAPSDLERCDAHVHRAWLRPRHGGGVARAATFGEHDSSTILPPREDLFFDRGERWKTNQAASFANGCGRVRRRCDRAPFSSSGLGQDDALFRGGKGIDRFLRTIDASPALRARQLLMVEESERRLAAPGRARPAPSPTTRTRASSPP